jgi:hypothetical protein
MVAVFIAVEKFTRIALLIGTPVAEQAGAMAVTAGCATVVKEQLKGTTGVPVVDFAAAVMETVMRVLKGRAPVGVNPTVLDAAEYAGEIVPGMGAVTPAAEVPVTVNDVLVMVVGSISLVLKVTMSGVVPTGTFTALHAGLVSSAVGATSRSVVKLHVLPAALTPRALRAAVLTVTVYVVLNARLLAGVKVATPLA